MANITKKNIRRYQTGVARPSGNLHKYDYRFETNASGVFVDSDSAAAVGNGDVVRLGILPAGLQLEDSHHTISDAFATSTTATLGFAYVDGVDDSAVPQDADYFAAALSTASTGISRKSNVTPPVVLPKDAYLILTVGGAAHSAAGRMDIAVIGEWFGPGQ